MNAFPTSSSRSAVATPPVMKRNYSVMLGVLCAALVLLPAPRARAQANAKPPTQLTYQGFLTDANGVPFGNTAPVNKTVLFRIYDALTGGTLKWSSQQVVTVDKGYFSVLLGQGSSVGSEPFNADLTGVFTGSSTASDRYLELTADGTTIAPRLRFLPAPYALLARSATELVDPVTGSNSLSIAGGVLSGNGAGLTAVNGTNISSGTIADSKLAVIATPGKVANSATTASAASTANTIVARDGAGNFSAGTITATGFSGGGGGLTNLNASQVSSGTLANDRTTATSSGTANAIVARDASGNTAVNVLFSTATEAQGAVTTHTQGAWLEWNKDGGSGMSYLLNQKGQGAGWMVFGEVSTANTITERMRIGANGNVGIGTTSTPVPLSVAANGEGVRITRSNGRSVTMYREDADFGFYVRGGTSQTGSDKTVRFDGDNNWDFPSDRRLKKDIVDAEPMLDRAMQVQVRRYRWKEDPDGGKLVLGVIAQELQPLFPHMVKEWEDQTTKEKTLSVGYGDFATIAIKSLQEFKQRHDAEVADLKQQLAELARANERLQAANQERDARLAAVEQFIASHRRTIALPQASVRDGK
jgi:hypothetical protein